MRKLLALASLALVPLAAVSQDRAVGVALERFGVIAGAWWINQKCKVLAGESAGEFSRDVAVVNTSLATSLNNPNLILSIQASGKRASESEKYASCPAEAQEIVSYAAAAASQWSGEIRRAVVDAATRLPGAPK